jgi:hypothetical protein
MKTAQQMTDAYKTGLASAGAAYVAGVNGVTVNPAQTAIANAANWVNGVQAAIANGSYTQGLSKVTLPAWQQASAAAASKLTGSASTAATKFGKYATLAQPQIAQFQQQIAAMPSATPADNDARALAMINMMRSLKGITKR